MTLSQLYREVTALCPELVCELDESFTAAARRAIPVISSQHRLEGTARIPISGQKPLTRVKKFHHTGKKAETLPLAGRAYSLTVVGEGQIAICDEEKDVTYNFSTEGALYRGFLQGEAQLELYGDYSFDVLGISCYGEIYSDRPEDIPDGSGFVTVELRSRIPDFAGFINEPTDIAGRPIKGLSAKDGRLTLPEDYSGEILVRYRSSPVCPSASETEENILIPKDSEQALTLLTAAWLTIEEDTERAEYYMSFYRTSERTRAEAGRGDVRPGYLVENGWA